MPDILYHCITILPDTFTRQFFGNFTCRRLSKLWPLNNYLRHIFFLLKTANGELTYASSPYAESMVVIASEIYLFSSVLVTLNTIKDFLFGCINSCPSLNFDPFIFFKVFVMLKEM